MFACRSFLVVFLLTAAASLSAAGLVANPTFLSFDTIGVGTTSAVQIVHITNTDVTTLDFSILISDTFNGVPTPDFSFNNSSLSNPACATSLAAGATCDVGVVFNPQSIGTKSTILQFLISKANSVTNFPIPLIGLAFPGLRFVPVTPCRVADTRDPNGPFGGPILTGGVSRDFPIPASACGVPSTAAAYSLNVTVVPNGVLGFLTLWPTGDSRPLASTLNSDGRTKANAAIVSAGRNGAVSAYPTQATHLIVDINGYFVDSSTNSSSLSYYPITPCRVADTRSTPWFSGALLAGQPRTIPVFSSPCDIPLSAQAYSLNFTAVPRAPIGFLAAWASGQPRPLVSTLNTSSMIVTANAAIVPAGTAGNIDVYSSNDTDLVVDILGYFAPPGSPGALSLYVVPPCRLLDTRDTSPLAAQTETVLSLNANPPLSCAVSRIRSAFLVNATVVPNGPLGYLTLWPSPVARPLASTLNASDGVITSNMAIVPAGSFLPTFPSVFSAYATQSTHLVLDVFGYFAP